jgi:hypothetical protein
VRALALTVVTAAAVVGLAAPQAQAAQVTHCDELKANVLCYDQGNDGTIYECVVWYERIQPENNPTCLAVF